MPSAAELEAIVTPEVSEHGFSGAVLVVRGNEVLFDRAYGLADIAANIANAPSTRFHIGTLSAQFTRAAIEHLIANRHLAWGNTADQFVVDAPRVTIRTLTDADPTTPEGRAAYRLLARVAESVTARPFADTVDAAAFGPLWLVGAGLDDGTASARNLAKGYLRGADGAVVPAASVDWAKRTGEGSAYLTTRDELAWIQRQFGTMASCQTPDWKSGAGAVEGSCTMSSHGDGFASYVVFAPSSSQLAIIVLANIDSDAAADLGEALAGRFSRR
jgi:CubicO group peptidase (beta-lactamase class C family)